MLWKCRRQRRASAAHGMLPSGWNTHGMLPTGWNTGTVHHRSNNDNTGGADTVTVPTAQNWFLHCVLFCTVLVIRLSADWWPCAATELPAHSNDVMVQLSGIHKKL